MPTKLLEGVSSKLADQWVATLLTPAFVFWAGGLLAYGDRHGFDPIETWFQQFSDPMQLGLIAIALCTVAASAFVAQRFDTAVLRGLEGYWYPGLRRLSLPLLHWQKLRRRRILKTLKQLNPKLSNNTATAAERAEFVRCDRALHQWPEQDDDLLPTRLGNILRAAERRPYSRYGLDAIVCWPRLWLLLPEAVKKDLQAAQTELNNAVRLVFWSLLFLIWSIWAWWAIPVGLITACVVYSWAIEAATVYASLIEATFDLHRQLLYQGLNWQRPDDPDEERRVGKQLTNYLWRG
ncbi:hypothetical protein [Leptolyngbya sp. PCC 6406]|uniref:hypothetical protein n=1 Tax=Leptolyngbya sp. PCC 6406 TaxID=1173264 RepID=UPI0002ACCE4B|nr:hypothetical protein [Leptolyngbya sp. PCC 6406]